MTHEPPLEPAPAGGIVLRWLVGLRWAVFALLSATLAVDTGLFGFHVHYAIAVPILALALGLNLVLTRWVRSKRGAQGSLITAVVALDLVAIAGVLAASGGAGNPFSALFFVHVALAAALLPARATFTLAALAACLFAALFALPSGACCPNHPEHGAFSAHLYGMLLAFVLSAGLVAYFVLGVRRALDASAAENAALRRRAEDASRFQALGALAAGTAHELGTPLGTIAVLAEETLRDPASSDEARRRARTIAEQVERCRVVIARMRADVRADGLRSGAELGAAVERGVAAWRAAHPEVAVEVRRKLDPDRKVPLDPADVEAAVCALLDNALHAVQAANARHAANAGSAPHAANAGSSPHAVQPGNALGAANAGNARHAAQAANAPHAANAGNARHAAQAANALGAANAGAAAREPIVVTVGDERGAPVICVEDGGVGVPPGLEGRLGEPFVTTKAPGEGMGLGLYLVRTLIEQVGGHLEVSARRPSGTRVALHLAPAEPMG